MPSYQIQRQNANYGAKIQNKTCYVKNFNPVIYTYNTNFRGQGSPESYIKTINPSKLNGSYVKTFNNFYSDTNNY
jgi:hypothetical protein